ncbi:hypothetical protein K9N08_04900 [Candidatus Gracilibacteria bacterium]|nr:hypothetical protein [Candidatus Gracilibacteria bacterium]
MPEIEDPNSRMEAAENGNGGRLAQVVQWVRGHLKPDPHKGMDKALKAMQKDADTGPDIRL